MKNIFKTVFNIIMTILIIGLIICGCASLIMNGFRIPKWIILVVGFIYLIVIPMIDVLQNTYDNPEKVRGWCWKLLKLWK